MCMSFIKNRYGVNELTYFITKWVFAIPWLFLLGNIILYHGRRNCPRKGPLVVMCKHVTWSDVPIVGIAVFRPMRYVIKVGLMKLGISRWFFRSTGAIPVVRNPGRAKTNSDAFSTIENILEKNGVILTYPEGTRTKGRIGRGKTGVVRAVMEYEKKTGRKVNILPVGLEYGRRFFWFRIVHARVGKPLTVDDSSSARININRIMEIIARLSGLKAETSVQTDREEKNNAG